MALKEPGISARLEIEQDAADITLYCSTRPHVKPEFEQARVVSFGSISLESSDDQGSASKSDASILFNDDDEYLRTLIAEDPIRFQSTTQVRLQILSRAGRNADLDYRSLGRFKLDGPPAYPIERNGHQRKRRVELQLADTFGRVLDQEVNPHKFLRTDFPDIHKDLENTNMPIIVGEFTDAGATDQNGNSAEVGTVPLIYVGMWDTVNDDPNSSNASYLYQIDDLAASGGGSGSFEYHYGVTKLSAVGETLLSNIVDVLDVAQISASNPITLTWSNDPEATGYIVYGRRNDTPVARLEILAAGVTSYVDTGAVPEHGPGPPQINTAQVPLEDDGFYWHLYFVGQGEITIVTIYGSDDAKGTQPSRINLNETARVDFLIPGFTGWPYGSNTLTIGGVEATYILGRGPRSQHHIDGVVTLAVNVCGPKGENDLPITQAYPALQWLLTQYCPMDGEPAWSTGANLPLREFADGTACLRTTKFTEAQDLTKQFLGNDDGYLASIYLREPITWREFIEKWHESFADHDARDHHGRWYPWLYNPYNTLNDGYHYRHRIEIKFLEAPEFDNSMVQPKRLYRYAYTPDTNEYRSPIETAEDPTASAAQPDTVRDLGTFDLPYIQDVGTARDAQGRLVQRLKYPRWKQVLVTRYDPGLEEEPGQQFRITHPDGPMPEWNNHAFICVSHTVDPMTGDVTLVGYEWTSAIITFQEPVMGAIDCAECPFIMR
jgi:hypothetical protein